MPNRLQAQVSICLQYNLDFVVSRAFITSTGRIVPKFAHLLPHRFLLLFLNPFIHGTLLVRTDSLLSVGCYNSFFKYAQDYDLFTRFFLAQLNYRYMPTPLYSLSVHSQSVSSVHKLQQVSYSRKIRLVYFSQSMASFFSIFKN